MHNAPYPPLDKSHLCPKLNKRKIDWLACISDGYAITNNHLYETNLFGRIIWELCDGKKNFQEIINESKEILLDYFAEDITDELMKDIETEIGRFLEVMEKEKLISWQKK